MAESVDAPDLKSVGHCARGSSSLPTRMFTKQTMKKLLLYLGVITLLPSVVFANEKKIKGYKTYDAMGCMIVRECTDNVKQIRDIADIRKHYPSVDYSSIDNEFNNMLVSLTKVGVVVFLAPGKYFPVNHRGVYHTVSNTFFLNEEHMDSQSTLMSVMRHEGWHAAQDCMAGTIENSLIAIIKPEEEVPMIWRTMVERTYPPHAIPWEAEATWAGKTESMTMEALKACAAGKMWEVFPPTPLTKKWLEEKGYIK